MIRVGRLVFGLQHWKKPLPTRHHDYPGGRPRPGRSFDWQLCLANNVGPLRILWIYTRDKDGEPLGRVIEWGWIPKRITT